MGACARARTYQCDIPKQPIVGLNIIKKCLNDIFKHFLIILSPTKKEVICAKKLGKGPFKSLDFQCDLCASQL